MLWLAVVGCGTQWESQLTLPAPTGASAEALEGRVGPGCHRPSGRLRLARPPITSVCVVNARRLNVIGLVGQPLLWVRTGEPSDRPVRTEEELRALGPVASPAEAVGRLFATAALDWVGGRLLDEGDDPARLAERHGWERVAPIRAPSITAEDGGYRIVWPAVRMERCHHDLWILTFRVARDGTLERVGETRVARGRVEICA